MLGDNLFQPLGFAVSNVIALNSLGEDNPLAATQFGLLFASSAVPLTYMQLIDGAVFMAEWPQRRPLRRRGPDGDRLHGAGAGPARLPRLRGQGQAMA